MPVLPIVPTSLPETRRNLHRVAEHVLGAVRFQREGRIGLRATPNGFGTPPSMQWQARVESTEMVVVERGEERRHELTTISELAEFVGCEPGAPTSVYHPTTPMNLDEPIVIDARACEFLADWCDFVTDVLERFRIEIDSLDSSEVELWPEHFDVAFEEGTEEAGERAGFGGSPGDDENNEPYLFVVPWSPRVGEVWNADSFAGAILTYRQLQAAADPTSVALSFFRKCRSEI